MEDREGVCEITLLMLYQKILYWLIMIMFLGEVESAVR